MEEDADLQEALVGMLSHLLNGYLTSFFVASGLVLNIFCIYIFLRCERASTPAIQYYLVTLTLWQTALLANAFLLYSLPNLLFGHLIAHGSYVHIYPYVYMFANTTHTGTVWIVLALTIDRYLALCHPMNHRYIGRKSRVKKIMVVVSLAAILFSVPRYFEVEVEYMEYDDGSMYPTIGRTALSSNSIYWSVYHVILAMLLVTLCPCLVLFSLTLIISWALRKAVMKRRQLCQPGEHTLSVSGEKRKNGVASKKEHKANIMLVVIIAKFLISDILPTVADVLEHLVGQNAFMTSRWASLFVDTSNFLIVLNCSSNFWVFIFFGKRFRSSCRAVLRGTAIGAAVFRIAGIPSYTGESSYCAPSSMMTTQAHLKTTGTFATSYRATTISSRESNRSPGRSVLVKNEVASDELSPLRECRPLSDRLSPCGQRATVRIERSASDERESE